MIKIDDEYISNTNKMIMTYLKSKNILYAYQPICDLMAKNYIRVVSSTNLPYTMDEYNKFWNGLRFNNDKPHPYKYCSTLLSLITELTETDFGFTPSTAHAYLMLKCDYVGDIESIIEQTMIQMIERLK